MASVLWTKPALNDLRDITEYIEKDSQTYAEKTARKLVSAPKILDQFPKIGRIVPEFGIETVRELIYRNFRIIYEIRGQTIYIEAIIHTSRNIDSHFTPGPWVIE